MNLAVSLRSPLRSSPIRWDNPLLALRSLTLRRRVLARDDSSFQYAVVGSLLLHAVVLFGVTIRPPDLSRLNMPMTLEVVLVNAKSSTKPVSSDLLGQRNLDGGGNTDADRRAKTPLPVVRNDPQTTDLSLQSRRVEQLEAEARNLMTQAKSQVKVDTPAAQPQAQPQVDVPTAPSANDILSRSLEIARLEAQIDKDLDSYQKRPRKHFVGGRVKEYRFARYEEDFRIKVERIGEVNYPQVARDQKIFGSLRLTVLIKSDGTVESVEVNRSSGQKILDEAAKRIVRLGEPYAAFPPDIAKDVDILGITRTWIFTRADRLVTE
jgi:protein TonB